MPDFIPSSDADFLAWVEPYSAKITATPTAYGLTAAMATTLAGKVTTFQTALDAATDPATRGGSTINAKDEARKDLVAYCRTLARQIQGTATVTNQQRYDLGLTVRPDTHSPIPPPSEAPRIDILSVDGNTVRIRLHDVSSTRRGRPAGVDGASVFSFVGPEAPTTEGAWKFEGNTTRTTMNVTFPNTVTPGSKVWFTAFWFNPRAQSGPPADAVGTNLPGGGAMAA